MAEQNPGSPVPTKFYTDQAGWTELDPNTPLANQPIAGHWFSPQISGNGMRIMFIGSSSGSANPSTQFKKQGMVVTSGMKCPEDRNSTTPPPVQALYYETNKPLEEVPIPPGFKFCDETTGRPLNNLAEIVRKLQTSGLTSPDKPALKNDNANNNANIDLDDSNHTMAVQISHLQTMDLAFPNSSYSELSGQNYISILHKPIANSSFNNEKFKLHHETGDDESVDDLNNDDQNQSANFTPNKKQTPTFKTTNRYPSCICLSSTEKPNQSSCCSLCQPVCCQNMISDINDLVLLQCNLADSGLYLTFGQETGSHSKVSNNPNRIHPENSSDLIYCSKNTKHNTDPYLAHFPQTNVKCPCTSDVEADKSIQCHCASLPQDSAVICGCHFIAHDPCCLSGKRLPTDGVHQLDINIQTTKPTHTKDTQTISAIKVANESQMFNPKFKISSDSDPSNDSILTAFVNAASKHVDNEMKKRATLT